MGWGYVQNTIFFFRAEMISRKHHFWYFYAIIIAVSQILLKLILIPLQNELVGIGIWAKHKFYPERKPFQEISIFGRIWL